MPIPVKCPGCAATLKAPDTAAGKRVKCPRCGGLISVAAPAPPAPAKEAVKAPARRPAKAPPPEEEPAPARPERRDRPEADEEPAPPRRRVSGLGIASLVVGGLALLVGWVP